MRRQPLLIMLLCFIIGVLLYDFFVFPKSIIVVLFFLSGFLFLVSFFYVSLFKGFRSCFLGGCFLWIGAFIHCFNSQKPLLHNFEGKHEVIFQLTKKINSNDKFRKYEVKAFTKVDGKPYDFNLVLYVSKSKKQLDFLHFYHTKMYINTLEIPENDFQFNYARYLSRKNIYYQGFVINDLSEAAKIKLTFSEMIKQKRLEVLGKIDASAIENNAKEFLKGIILADRTEMDEAMVSDFSKSGLVHFLAISGTHLAIIFWLILYLLNLFFSAKYRRIPILASLFFIWSFTIFIDFGSSVVRSCLMITAYYSFLLLQRKPDLLHAMSIAGFVILIFDTHQIFDVGFQLSFIAVLGIFWLNNPILKYFPKPSNQFQNFFLNIISVSFSAQIATLPLVVFYFHQYSFLSIIANLLIIPFSEVIIIFSLLMTFLISVNVDFHWLNFLYDNIVEFLLKSIHFFASQDLFFVKNIPLDWAEVVLAFLIVYLLKSFLQRENKKLVPFFGALVLFFLVRFSINYIQFRKSETLILKNFNQEIVIQKAGNKAIFWVDKKVKMPRIKSFIIEPYLVSRRIEKYEIRFFENASEGFRIRR